MKPPHLLLFILPLIAASASARTLHVAASAGKSGDGFSWGSPYKTLQEALMRVESGETILIAEGTYTANELRRGGLSDRDLTFSLPGGVDLIGGYSPNGRERDVSQFRTVLSGDLFGDRPDNDGDGLPDGRTDSGRASHHILTIENPSRPTVLDGLWFVNGFAEDGSIGSDPGGAAILAKDGGGLTVRNCYFRFNRTTRQDGSAIYYKEAPGDSKDPVVIEGCTFISNGFPKRAPAGGNGAVYVESTAIEVTDCVFESNRSDGGGGLEFVCTHELGARPDSRIENCVFRGNFSSFVGGAMILNGEADIVISQCLFSGNHAGEYGFINGDGGAIYVATGGTFLCENSTFAWNSAGSSVNRFLHYGGAVAFSDDGFLTEFRNNLFHKNYAANGFGVFISSVDTGPRSDRTVIYKSNYSEDEDLPDSDPDYPNRTPFSTLPFESVEFVEGIELTLTTVAGETRYGTNPGGDFRLVPDSAISDFGERGLLSPRSNATDLAGSNRFQGRNIDPGAYEAQPLDGTLRIDDVAIENNFFYVYFTSSSRVDVDRSVNLGSEIPGRVSNGLLNSPFRVQITAVRPRAFYTFDFAEDP